MNDGFYGPKTQIEIGAFRLKLELQNRSKQEVIDYAVSMYREYEARIRQLENEIFEMGENA